MTRHCAMMRVAFGMRSVVAKNTMPAIVKLAREIDESSTRDIGQPTAECQLKVWPSWRRLVHGEVSSGPCSVEQEAQRSVSWRCTRYAVLYEKGEVTSVEEGHDVEPLR